MKKILTTVLILVLGITGFSRDWKAISSQVPEAGKVRLISTNAEGSVINFSLGGFYLREATTPQGIAFSVEVDKLTPILDAGAPNLPKMTTSLIIPDLAEMEINTVSVSYKDYADIFIAPSKGVIMRDTDPSTVPYQFGAAYSKDQFYPGQLTGLREPYIIRDIRGQTIIVYPFQYNPVTRVLRVFTDITLKLRKVNYSGKNPLPFAIAEKKISPELYPVLQKHFLNFDAMNYTPLNDYGNLLVICYGAFMSEMQPYVDWKIASGYSTEIISKDSVGTTASQIKTFIANYYNTKGLTHVLLVGDNAQIPTNTGGTLGGPSDNAYGYIVGIDHYSDVYIGRFSAETVAQVQTQVQRTLDYEMNPQFITDDWFTTVIGIGSDQGPGDDNEMDFEHVRNQQTQLLAYKYTSNPELFDGSQGGNDAAGNPTPPMVATQVNNGASLILYTGHGSNTSWGTTGFSNNNVNQLTNMGKLPFIWSVACVNGNFTSGTCFAEAWLRASQGGQPTGAIAFLGSTINQSWDSPMEGQDEMTDILAESYPENIKRTFAGISINGCMKMIDSYGLDGSNMADTWTVFGDPTIMVRTSAPEEMVVNHNSSLVVGDSSLLLTCSVNGARVTLTVSDTILATGVVQNDSLILGFPPLTNPDDTIRLVVTAYNNIPYQSYLPVDEVIILPVSASFSGTPERVLPGQTVNFADTSSGTVISREWSFPGGTPSSSSEKNPVVTYDARGVFDVQLIVGNGITYDTLMKSEYITCDFPTGTAVTNESAGVYISPNPNNGIFTLNLSSITDVRVDITIFNMVGTKTYESLNVPVSGNLEKAITLPDVPKGLYFLQVKGGENTYTRKVVIR
ncbi:MAG: C25 family cysteine peptidase [Bacteroidetes bacterium]|nr:C25 family cysteine peptidase [Bacteroidota bacterium]